MKDLYILANYSSKRRQRRCQQKHLEKPDATTCTQTLTLTTIVTLDITLIQTLALTQKLTLIQKLTSTQISTLTHKSTLTQNLTEIQIDFADKGFIIKTIF